MANQEEVRDVYGYFEQKGNALCYRYEAERVRIEHGVLTVFVYVHGKQQRWIRQIGR